MSEQTAKTPAKALTSETDSSSVIEASETKSQTSSRAKVRSEKPATARYAPVRKAKSKRSATAKVQSSTIAVDQDGANPVDAKDEVNVSTKSVTKKRASAPKKAMKVSKAVSESTTTTTAKTRSVSSKKAQKPATSEKISVKSAAVNVETGVEERGISGNALNDVYQLNLNTASQMIELIKTESQAVIEINRRLACELLDLKAPTALPHILNNYYIATQSALHNAIEERQKVMRNLFQI